MRPLSLGVMADDLGLGVRAGILRAAALGLDCVQLSCVRGELQLGSLSESARRGVRSFVKDQRLRLSAISASYPQGLRDPDANNRIVPAVCTFIKNARDVGATVVTIWPGRVRALSSGDPGTKAAREALIDLTECADTHGVLLATDVTGAEAQHLHVLLTSIASDSLGANLDPGLIAADGGSALGSVRLFAPMTIHVQARHVQEDTTMYSGVPWSGVLSTLLDADYHGCVSLAKEPSADRISSVEERIRVFRALIDGRLGAPPREMAGTGEIQVTT